MSNQSFPAKALVFKHLQAHGLQVSNAFCIGLPAMTAFTGLSTAFCLKLAEALGIDRKSFANKGIAVALDDYQFLSSYRKAFKKKDFVSEQITQAFANASLHLAFCIEPQTVEAFDAFEQRDLAAVSAEILSGMQLAKARLVNVRKPSVLSSAEHGHSDGALELSGLVLSKFPLSARLIADAGEVLIAMRESGLDVTEGLICATLRPDQRPEAWSAFYKQSASTDGFEHRLAVVHSGYLQVDDEGASSAMRTGSFGQPSFVASPTLGLVRLQTVGSARVQFADKEGSEAGGAFNIFWSLIQPTERQWHCTTYSDEEVAETLTEAC